MDTQPTTPPIPPPIEEMNRIWLWLIETLKNQGLSFLLLGVAVWHLQGQNNELNNHVRICQEEKYNALISVVQANTDALNKLVSNGKEATPQRKK